MASHSNEYTFLASQGFPFELGCSCTLGEGKIYFLLHFCVFHGMEVGEALVISVFLVVFYDLFSCHPGEDVGHGIQKV